MKKFNIVVGSWGSYNACNDRALGSKWLDLADFESWEEIKEELTKEGFELNGIDEELFIQDCEMDLKTSYDHLHPKTLFTILKESGVLDSSDDELYDKMMAYIEAESWDSFVSLVEENGESWDSCIDLYSDCADFTDLAYLMVDECGFPENLSYYFDYQEYGRDLSIDSYVEISTDSARLLVDECGFPENLSSYFDYEAFGRDLSFGDYTKTSYGILKIG